MTHAAKAREVIGIEIAALQQLKKRVGSEFDCAVEMLLSAVRGGKKIVATGVGKSGHIAEKTAATLTSTGAPCVYLNCLNAVHGDLGIVSEGDAVLIFSYSGETDEIVRMLPAIARPNVSIISLTGHPRSTIATNSSIHINVNVKREACPLNLAPTASTTAMLATGDALAMVLLEARGFRKEDFAKNHPGGSIGKNLLLRVGEVMRSKEKVAVVQEKESVMHALKAISDARAGAAIVINKNGKLAGIFTQGDFARFYQDDLSVGSKCVGQLMTRRPITVRVDKLAVEVLNIFEKHHIDDLIVIDQKGHPVGVVDAQDLAKYRLV